MGIFDKLIRAFKPNLREKQNKINSWGKTSPEEEKSSVNFKEELVKLKTEIQNYGFGEKNPLEKLDEKIIQLQEKLKSKTNLLTNARTQETKAERTQIVNKLQEELASLQTKRTELSEKIKQYNTLVKEQKKD